MKESFGGFSGETVFLYANDPNVLIGVSAVFVFLGHLFPVFSALRRRRELLLPLEFY